MSNPFRYVFGNKAKEKVLMADILKDIEIESYQKKYLLGRFLDILYDDFDIIAIKNKLAFQLLRFSALISGALVPIIVNLKEEIMFLGLDRTALATVLGLLSSISFGFLQIFQNEKVWLHHRETFEILRTECYKFLNLTGEYKAFSSHKLAFQRFVGKTEDLIKNDIKNYKRIVDIGEKDIKPID